MYISHPSTQDRFDRLRFFNHIFNSTQPKLQLLSSQHHHSSLIPSSSHHLKIHLPTHNQQSPLSILKSKMVNTSFSDQVFQQLQIKPIINLDPTTTTSSNLSLNQLRPSIYDQDYHLPSLPTSPLKLSNSPIRSALRPTPPLSSARQHKSPSLHPRSPRSRTGSSGACSDLSVRFSSVSSLRSTQPHSPPTPDKRQTYRTLALIPPPIPPSLPPTRSTSALSRASFRSISSIGSRLRAKLTPSSSSQSKPPCELSWANLRAEYELHLARGSLIERCLVDVSLNPDEHPTIAKRWTDRVVSHHQILFCFSKQMIPSAEIRLRMCLRKKKSIVEASRSIKPFIASRHVSISSRWSSTTSDTAKGLLRPIIKSSSISRISSSTLSS